MRTGNGLGRGSNKKHTYKEKKADYVIKNIIIKNFDVPKSCRDCAFARGEYLDMSWEKGYCGLGEGIFNKHSDTQRLKSCPLTEGGAHERKRNRISC